MKRIVLVFMTSFLSLLSFSQKINKIINADEVGKIEEKLSSDEMAGRKTFSAEIDNAANVIAKEFKKNKLQFFGNSSNYFQEFSMIKLNPIQSVLQLNDDTVAEDKFYIHTTEAELNYTSTQGFEIVNINKSDDFSIKIRSMLQAKKNTLVLIDTSYATQFKRIKPFLLGAHFALSNQIIFIVTSLTNITTFKLKATNEILVQQLKNVVGILPGKSAEKKGEYVIFSGHYDHLGIGKPNAEGDSIYNGANDDAAGTTAVMMLSRYFSKIKNNERSIIFVAFTAEEMGGFGSQYFSRQLNSDSVAAMFNIEMIGTESKWGTNSAYITGFEKSDMGKILQGNLVNSKFHFESDPYPEQNLFYRSDNATLAALGVPAHTISTSKMDNEKFYHTQDDEIETLDMNNMAEIIKAIAICSQSIISRKDSATRVKKD